MDRRAKVFSAELIGTTVLILGGPGSAILAGDVIGIGGISLAFGLSLLVMVYAIGEISGCHINPAVTLGMWLHKKTPGNEVPFYVVGQLIGAAIGGLVIFAIASGLSGFDAHFQRGDALSQLWVFVVFPLIGAIVGFLIWKVIGEERTGVPG